jgi:lipoate-protein ligase A
VGEAYALARECGLRVHTITSYEHLRETLTRLADDGVAAYVGMCCQHFYIKRTRAFEDAGMAAVLLDISGSNCYELRQEEAAYTGRFTAQARIDVAVLRNVLAARR